MGILNNFIDKIARVRNPIKYWRKRGVVIGRDCEIYSSVDFGSEPYLITIGDHVRVAGGVRFITHDGAVWVLREKYEELSDIDLFGRISIGNNVHIGMEAIVMPNVKIGNNCVIGCGAIVTKDIPDNSIAVGIPAKVIETVDDYAEKHRVKFVNTKHLSATQKKNFLTGKDADANK